MNFGFILAYVFIPIIISSYYILGLKFNKDNLNENSIIVCLFSIFGLKFKQHSMVASAKLFKNAYYIVLAIFIILKLILQKPNIENSVDGLTLSLALMEGLFGFTNHIFEESKLSRRKQT